MNAHTPYASFMPHCNTCSDPPTHHLLLTVLNVYPPMHHLCLNVINAQTPLRTIYASRARLGLAVVDLDGAAQAGVRPQPVPHPLRLWSPVVHKHHRVVPPHVETEIIH